MTDLQHHKSVERPGDAGSALGFIYSQGMKSGGDMEEKVTKLQSIIVYAKERGELAWGEGI